MEENLQDANSIFTTMIYGDVPTITQAKGGSAFEKRQISIIQHNHNQDNNWQPTRRPEVTSTGLYGVSGFHVRYDA